MFVVKLSSPTIFTFKIDTYKYVLKIKQKLCFKVYDIVDIITHWF